MSKSIQAAPLQKRPLTLDARLGGHLLKGTVAFVAIQAVGLLLTADEEIEKAVVVVVGPGAQLELTGSSRPASLGDIGEGAVAVVAQQQGRIGYISQAPRGMKMSIWPSLL